MERKKLLKAFPKDVSLRDGSIVTLRLMTIGDEVALLDFFRKLPEKDRLFLKDDVTDPEVISHWAKNLDYNKVIPIVALKDGEIIGEGSLHMNTFGWSLHVGEIRLVVSRDHRREGLGFLLTKEIFFMALSLGLQKVIAETTEKQVAVIQILKAIGFTKEAVLKNHVIDQNGDIHDLLIMSNDTKSIWKKMEDLIRVSTSDRSGYYRI